MLRIICLQRDIVSVNPQSPDFRAVVQLDVLEEQLKKLARIADDWFVRHKELEGLGSLRPDLPLLSKMWVNGDLGFADDGADVFALLVKVPQLLFMGESYWLPVVGTAAAERLYPVGSKIWL